MTMTARATPSSAQVEGSGATRIPVTWSKVKVWPWSETAVQTLPTRLNVPV